MGLPHSRPGEDVKVLPLVWDERDFRVQQFAVAGQFGCHHAATDSAQGGGSAPESHSVE